MSDRSQQQPGVAAGGSGFGAIAQLLNEADAVAHRLGFGDPALRAAYHAHVLMILAGAYVETFGTDVAGPDWVPYIPSYLSRAAPNPDTVYGFAPIDAAGTYRIAGQKGSETIAAITLRKGGAQLGQRCGARVAELDFADVKADADGRFSFILSATPPVGYTGQWFALHPDTSCLMLRRVTKNATQTDGVCGLERLDKPAPAVALTPAQIEQRMQNMVRYAAGQNEFLLGYMQRLHALGAEQNFVLDDQSAYGGLIVQSHYFHKFQLAPDEALIMETNLPRRFRYWSIQVINPFASTIDYVHHQSSLNDEQARADADGRVRVVLAHQDPGVPNWLDPAGWRQGGVQWRWNEVDTAPHPTVRKITFSQLRDALPADTPRVDAGQRRESLAARAAYYQSRRR